MIRKAYYLLTGKRKIYDLISKYERSQFSSLAEIEKYQLKLLNKLLLFILENNEYYKNILQKNNINLPLLSIKDLQKIPFLTKAIVKGNFNAITSKNINKKRKIPNSTSGSTGTNFKFLTDKNSLLYRQALNVRMDSWLGFKKGNKKFSIWGASFEAGKNRTIKQRLKDKYNNTIIVSGYNLTHDNMMKYCNKIQEFKPQLITGYPSTLTLFSEFLLQNNLSYHPEAIRTEGETLYPFQREIIEKAFHTSVFGFYSSREISGIAHECSAHKGLHIFSENLIIEIVDDNGNVIDEGEGEIVLTDLHNYVMPLIRYRIGDRAVISKRKCNCGINLPLLENVEGRTFDIIKFPNGNSVSGTFWTLLLKSKPGIDDFQVNQKQDETIQIIIKINDKYNPDLNDYLLDKIRDFGGKNIKVIFSIVDKIPLTKGGKRRYIMSELNK